MVECNDPLQRCFEGNLFRANMPRSNVVIEGAVNGDFTGPLPNGEVFKLDNSGENGYNSTTRGLGPIVPLRLEYVSAEQSKATTLLLAPPASVHKSSRVSTTTPLSQMPTYGKAQ